MEALHALQYGLPEDIRRLKESGQFAEALRLIELRLAERTLPRALREALTAQKRICQQISAEFPYTKAQALALIREKIPDFPQSQLEEWLDQRRIRWILAEGEMRIFDRFFSSLCKTIPEFARQADPQALAEEEKNEALLNDAMQTMMNRGSMSLEMRVRASVSLPEEAFRPSMLLRAHLPLPAQCPQQSEIRIEALSPAWGAVAPVDAAQRTVCWEGRFEENPRFEVEYSYRSTTTYVNAYDAQGTPGCADFDLQQQEPHIVFTPYLRALCRELTEGLADPLAKARRIYDYITQTMRYTYMPSYVLLENIPQECAMSGTGDCGVFSLLFITLCRCVGIPAQWQSGLVVQPNLISGHDWARFYCEPFGWLFADPSYGIDAALAGNEQRRRFYFGNLDPYRMVANSAFQAPFTIDKQHFRADPYDNQLGEIETEERGFAFGEYCHSLERAVQAG